MNWKKRPEITLEMNPGTVTEEKLRCYQENGVNRLSIGLQSVNNEKLKLLGRIHTYEEFLESYELARQTGFDNISVDLISSIPGQKLEEWKEELSVLAALSPEHISVYQLILEEGTPFFEKYAEHPELLPEEEESREIYLWTGKFLKEQRYEQYEISNYAKPGRESRHNLKYWERGDYLGLGLGAASTVMKYPYEQHKGYEYLSGTLRAAENHAGRRAVSGRGASDGRIYVSGTS